MKILKALLTFFSVFAVGHYILWFSGVLASRPAGEVAVALLLFALAGGMAAIHVLASED